MASLRPNSAKYSFGKSSDREARTKCGDILVATNSDFLGRTSPGCTYNIPPEVGRPGVGYSFGTAQRPQSGKEQYPPTSGDILGIVPKHVKYAWPVARRPVMGTEARSGPKGSGCSPGCIYQPDDRFTRPRSAPSYTMGAKTLIIGTRKPDANAAPGLFKSLPPQAHGKQILSTKKSAPTGAFSKASRFMKPRPDNNKAGATSTVPRGLGKQPDLKSPPLVTLRGSSREKRNSAGCMITSLDRGPLAKFDGPNLAHHKSIPPIMARIKHGF